MKLHKNNNLAYHHIRGWIMVVGTGLARLDCTTNSDISTSWRGVFNKQTMSIVGPSWAGWDWHWVNNQTETDPKSPEEQTAGAGWVWAWFDWCSDITGCCFNTIIVSHGPGLLPVCSWSNYRHHTADHPQASWHRVCCHSSLSLLASPGLS